MMHICGLLAGFIVIRFLIPGDLVTAQDIILEQSAVALTTPIEHSYKGMQPTFESTSWICPCGAFLFLFYLLGFTAQRLKVCRTLGPTAFLKILTEKHAWKRCRKEKKSMIAPRQPQTCSHPIYARMLTGVCQAIRMFSPCFFSCTCIHRNPGEWLITLMKPNGYHFFIYCSIKLLNIDVNDLIEIERWLIA